MAEIANADQRAFWNEQKGDLWVRFQPRIDAMLAPFGDRAIEALDPSPGAKVLEIGCGTGGATLALADRIGPTGEILAADISRPMLDRAVARAVGRTRPAITFLEADAQVHDFGHGEFDAAYSRFGVMFFERPVAAFQNILRALRSGGRLAFVCWATRTDNPWVLVPTAAAKRFLDLPPPPPDDAPGQFSMQHEDRIQRILREAGWADVSVERFEIDHRTGADTTDAVTFACQMGPMAGPLAEADDETRRKVANAIREALEPYAGPQGVQLRFSTWIVTAKRP